MKCILDLLLIDTCYVSKWKYRFDPCDSGNHIENGFRSHKGIIGEEDSNGKFKKGNSHIESLSIAQSLSYRSAPRTSHSFAK